MKSRGHTPQRGPRERGGRQSKKPSHTQGRKRGREKYTPGGRANQRSVEERVKNAPTRKAEGGYRASKTRDTPERGTHEGKGAEPQATPRTTPRGSAREGGTRGTDEGRQHDAPQKQGTHRITTHPPAHKHRTGTTHTTHTHARPPAPRTGGTPTPTHPRLHQVSDRP